jgi:hypothetical protein
MYGGSLPNFVKGDLVVELGGHPLPVEPGSYAVEEADQFGQRVSTGPLTHDDLNPHTSSAVVTNLSGGYGLRRFSDLDDRDQAAKMYSMSNGVDCRFGQAILGPSEEGDYVTGYAAAAVWIGDIPWGTAGALQTWGVFGPHLFRQAADGVWTEQGASVLVQAPTCVAFFNDRLICGYGAARTAQFITNGAPPTVADIEDENGAALYVWALTADNSQLYIAGGPAVTDFAKVMASTTHTLFDTFSTVTCGSPDTYITDLAPGGGVATVYVGKETELGGIDLDGTYRVLVPFDTRSLRNCKNMTWWLGRMSAEQRGPMILVFPRERALWTFEPQGDTMSGRAQNISAWAHEAIRPSGARGRIVAIQGSARWLYYAVVNDSPYYVEDATESPFSVKGGSMMWINAMDARTGAHHTLFNVSAGSHAEFLAVAGASVGAPRLYYSTDDAVLLRPAGVYLPLDGDSPRDAPESYLFSSYGDLFLADADFGFPDEEKVWFSIRIAAENLLAPDRFIDVYYRIDGGVRTYLGQANSGEVTELAFPSTTVGKRLTVHLHFETGDPEESPVLLGASARASLNLRLYKRWRLVCTIPRSEYGMGSLDYQDPKRLLDTLWESRRDGVPIDFKDRWRDRYKVRVLKMQEADVASGESEVPGTAIELVLLEHTTVSVQPVFPVVT